MTRRLTDGRTDGHALLWRCVDATKNNSACLLVTHKIKLDKKFCDNVSLKDVPL